MTDLLTEIVEIIGALKSGASATDAVTTAIKNARDLLKKPQSASPADVRSVESELEEALDKVILLKQMQLHILNELTLLKAKEIEVEERLSALDKFENDVSKYTLTETSLHSHVYALKEEFRANNAATYLCVPCFDKKVRSLLQLKKRNFGHDAISCTICGYTARVPNDLVAEVLVAKRSRSIWGDDAD